MEKLHGTKGEVVVVALRGLPFLITEGMRVALTPPALNRERVSTVERATPGGDGATGLVRFSCAHNLDEASALTGCFVLAEAEGLDLEPLTAAVDDLIDRTVADDRLGMIGRITEVICGPANDAWVVEGPYGEAILPVIPDVVLDLPETGDIPVHLPGGILPEELFEQVVQAAGEKDAAENAAAGENGEPAGAPGAEPAAASAGEGAPCA